MKSSYNIQSVTWVGYHGFIYERGASDAGLGLIGHLILTDYSDDPQFYLDLT